MPETGFVTVNGEKVGHENIEWFRQNCSAIFTDFHLFEDYLGFDRAGIDDEVRRYLTELQLAHKVSVHDGRLSTVALSAGQRKRLALLTVLLEDRPIYLFDEWAADQEPRFREVFYTEILPGLARRGKTVIVITHDDRYFHCADQIVKLDFGQSTTPNFHHPPRLPLPKTTEPSGICIRCFGKAWYTMDVANLWRSCPEFPTITTWGRSVVSATLDEGRNRRPSTPLLCDHAGVAGRVEYRSWMSDNLRWTRSSCAKATSSSLRRPSAAPRGHSAWFRCSSSTGPTCRGRCRWCHRGLIRPLRRSRRSSQLSMPNAPCRTSRLTRLSTASCSTTASPTSVGRDPRDAAMSMIMDWDRMWALRTLCSRRPGSSPPRSRRRTRQPARGVPGMDRAAGHGHRGTSSREFNPAALNRDPTSS